ncbi:MAG TPA: hypothetical protein VFJ13_00895, partial [Paracoccaceae bacterium]|nr:hypothetical protein [Paracoccaceae bacterium]
MRDRASGNRRIRVAAAGRGCHTRAIRPDTPGRPPLTETDMPEDRLAALDWQRISDALDET